MMEIDEGISVVVFANRKDFALAKICIASIRYFYPEINVFLLKDKLNGDFSTGRLCRALNVKLIDLGRKYFGWGAAKVHFCFSKDFSSKRFLCLDADTIFTGKVMDKLEATKEYFVVNAEPCVVPLTQEVTDLYLDPEKVKKYYHDYSYPGYFFNTGQFVATPGLLCEALLAPSFDVHTYPFYKNRDAFQLVDQAVLNAVIPLYADRNNMQIGQQKFMHWSVSFFYEHPNLAFTDLDNNRFPFIIHYAGDVRSHDVNKMKGTALLTGFRNSFYKKLNRWQILQDKLQDFLLGIKSLNQVLYRKNWVSMKLAVKLGAKS